MRLFSYVVRYDSGFAPNPFYNFCTLATCKPSIRRTAKVGDWIVGCGSAAKNVMRGGHLVHAMEVTEILSFQDYWQDPRFQSKKPIRNGSRKQSCGDNIYYPLPSGEWGQLDSYHSLSNGSHNPDHVARDTGINRVLVSNNYRYFGGHGPVMPDFDGTSISKKGIGYSTYDAPNVIASFSQWFNALPSFGFVAAPWDWKKSYA